MNNHKSTFGVDKSWEISFVARDLLGGLLDNEPEPVLQGGLQVSQGVETQLVEDAGVRLGILMKSSWTEEPVENDKFSHIQI